MVDYWCSRDIGGLLAAVGHTLALSVADGVPGNKAPGTPLNVPPPRGSSTGSMQNKHTPAPTPTGSHHTTARERGASSDACHGHLQFVLSVIIVPGVGSVIQSRPRSGCTASPLQGRSLLRPGMGATAHSTPCYGATVSAGRSGGVRIANHSRPKVDVDCWWQSWPGRDTHVNASPSLAASASLYRAVTYPGSVEIYSPRTIRSSWTLSTGWMLLLV